MFGNNIFVATTINNQINQVCIKYEITCFVVNPQQPFVLATSF
jgi:hypothetical protein